MVPGFPLRNQLANEFFVSRELIGLSQGDKMLVAVQLPCDLGVPDFLEIQVTNLKPGLAWTAFLVDQIEMPVDLRAIIQILVSQQVESMSANSFRAGHNARSGRRQALLQDLTNSGHFRRRKEEPSSFPANLPLEACGKVMAPPLTIGVQASRRMLPNAIDELAPAHRSEPLEAPSPGGCSWHG